jgi:hypothetical protein
MRSIRPDVRVGQGVPVGPVVAHRGRLCSVAVLPVIATSTAARSAGARGGRTGLSRASRGRAGVTVGSARRWRARCPLFAGGSPSASTCWWPATIGVVVGRAGPRPQQRSTTLSTVDDDRQPVDSHGLHHPDSAARKRTGQHGPGRTPAETAHRQRSTIGAPLSHIVEDRIIIWE